MTVTIYKCKICNWKTDSLECLARHIEVVHALVGIVSDPGKLGDPAIKPANLDPDQGARVNPAPDGDEWGDRAKNMRCNTCMAFKAKRGNIGGVGRCRHNAPTIKGFPVVYENGWCLDHKINENRVIEPIKLGAETYHFGTNKR